MNETLESIRKEKDALMERLLIDYGKLENSYNALRMQKSTPNFFIWVAGLSCFCMGIIIGYYIS